MVKKLGKNKNGYFGETIDIDNVIQECVCIAEKKGWKTEILPVLGGCDIPVFSRSQKIAKKKVYISAGIHGDEPAGPMTVLELLRKNEWPEDIDISIFPCLNPTGFKKNTRENDKNIDLNRDYYHSSSPEIVAHKEWIGRSQDFDLVLCLHEDWESKGFYLYESIQPHHTSISKKIVESVKQIFPIDDSPEIDGYYATDGIIGAPIDNKTLTHWPEALYFFEVKKSSNYTLETSSDFILDERVKTMSTAVNTALNALKDQDHVLNS